MLLVLAVGFVILAACDLNNMTIYYISLFFAGFGIILILIGILDEIGDGYKKK